MESTRSAHIHRPRIFFMPLCYIHSPPPCPSPTPPHPPISHLQTQGTNSLLSVTTVCGLRKVIDTRSYSVEYIYFFIRLLELGIIIL